LNKSSAINVISVGKASSVLINKNKNNVQLMDLGPDMDVDATFMEHDDLEGNDLRMDGELFIEEYKGAAKEFGAGTTFMDKFNCDQQESALKISTIYLYQGTNGSLLLFYSILISAWLPLI
jgi:hypothetical protein